MKHKGFFEFIVISSGETENTLKRILMNIWGMTSHIVKRGVH
jgi:hypothetical protein